MRLILSPFFLAILTILAALEGAQAQSITQNLPSGDQAAVAPPANPDAQLAGGDPYTVTDVNADVTADTAAHARDQALMQAERTALTQLCTRFGANSAIASKFGDDEVANLVQSFEVQSEHLSAVRYIGVFTIHFNQVAVQKNIGTAMTIDPTSSVGQAPPVVPVGPASHLPVTIETSSLQAWTEIKRRLGTVPAVTHVEVLSLGRGTSRIDLSYNGAFEDFQQALNNAGFVLLQGADGGWQLNDGSMIAR